MSSVITTITVFMILLSICAFKISLSRTQNREQFTFNDFYDKHYEDISIPTQFYEITAQVVPNHYTIEMHDRFFISNLDIEKKQYPKNPSLVLLKDDVEKSVKDEIEKRTGDYLKKLFNSKLGSNEVFLFRSIYDIVESVKKGIWKYGVCYLANTRHLLYRDTKIYGVAINLTTLHDKRTGNIYLADYKLVGFVFQDKIDGALEPTNLVQNDYQEYTKDTVTQYDKKYEKNYLCKYYSDLKKFRGISVNTQDLGC